MDFATTTLPLSSMTWNRCSYLFSAGLDGSTYTVGEERQAAHPEGRTLQSYVPNS